MPEEKKEKVNIIRLNLGSVRIRDVFRGSDPDLVFFLEGRIRVNPNRIRTFANKVCKSAWEVF